jgi:diacylglycerol kinase family enzyme
MNKGLFGRLAYVPAIAQAAILTRPIPAEIMLGDEVFRMSFLQFVAASGAYHGGFFSVTREASISDGLLSVYAVQQAERTSLLRYGFGLVTGTHTDLSEIWSHEAVNITVKTGRVRKWVIDGDIVRTAVAKLSIVPNGLLVLRAFGSP